VKSARRVGIPELNKWFNVPGAAKWLSEQFYQEGRRFDSVEALIAFLQKLPENMPGISLNGRPVVRRGATIAIWEQKPGAIGKHSMPDEEMDQENGTWYGYTIPGGAKCLVWLLKPGTSIAQTKKGKEPVT
jgi:hypothetical protein